jgi:hypothetical protein
MQGLDLRVDFEIRATPRDDQLQWASLSVIDDIDEANLISHIARAISEAG